jgi:hypothetical protein
LAKVNHFLLKESGLRKRRFDFVVICGRRGGFPVRSQAFYFECKSHFRNAYDFLFVAAQIFS